MQPSNTKILCAAIADTATRLCNLVPEATAVANKFRVAFTKFSACHKLYSGNYMEDEDIDKLGIWKHHHSA